MLFQVLADLVVLVHFGFIVFALLGALLALRWPRVLWVHAPAAIWAVAIELGGWICPLTPLENRLRGAGGAALHRALHAPCDLPAGLDARGSGRARSCPARDQRPSLSGRLAPLEKKPALTSRREGLNWNSTSTGCWRRIRSSFYS
jgi:hypothetical protein